MFEESIKKQTAANERSRKMAQYGTIEHRGEFWKFCQQAVGRLRSKSRNLDIPFDLTAFDLDQMFIEQEWCCAVSGIMFDPPGSDTKNSRRPFGPSIDRIIPKNGYVKKNVRIVTNMVNVAMSDWGAETFWQMVRLASLHDPDPKALARYLELGE